MVSRLESDSWLLDPTEFSLTLKRTLNVSTIRFFLSHYLIVFGKKIYPSRKEFFVLWWKTKSFSVLQWSMMQLKSTNDKRIFISKVQVAKKILTLPWTWNFSLLTRCELRLYGVKYVSITLPFKFNFFFIWSQFKLILATHFASLFSFELRPSRTWITFLLSCQPLE